MGPLSWFRHFKKGSAQLSLALPQPVSLPAGIVSPFGAYVSAFSCIVALVWSNGNFFVTTTFQSLFPQNQVIKGLASKPTRLQGKNKRTNIHPLRKWWQIRVFKELLKQNLTPKFLCLIFLASLFTHLIFFPLNFENLSVDFETLDPNKVNTNNRS